VANAGNFAHELNELIRRYLQSGSDSRAIDDELMREANLVFTRYNLETYVAAWAKPEI
jgi:hypothetical protein